ncbi:hypothetical protein BIW11_12519 [Tropilaelaps mercedesae]|uniref:Uncharacterized protein n=1 Tax=Tropilaelaps mercedesae TaxID=418985 RepID=A0A1V9X6K3_9ACAR|nr:hypothetical protein BIW11_12519 [Tropilaelaps mercedesae]
MGPLASEDIEALKDLLAQWADADVQERDTVSAVLTSLTDPLDLLQVDRNVVDVLIRCVRRVEHAHQRRLVIRVLPKLYQGPHFPVTIAPSHYEELSKILNDYPDCIIGTLKFLMVMADRGWREILASKIDGILVKIAVNMSRGSDPSRIAVLAFNTLAAIVRRTTAENDPRCYTILADHDMFACFVDIVRSWTLAFIQEQGLDVGRLKRRLEAPLSGQGSLSITKVIHRHTFYFEAMLRQHDELLHGWVNMLLSLMDGDTAYVHADRQGVLFYEALEVLIVWCGGAWLDGILHRLYVLMERRGSTIVASHIINTNLIGIFFRRYSDSQMLWGSDNQRVGYEKLYKLLMLTNKILQRVPDAPGFLCLDFNVVEVVAWVNIESRYFNDSTPEHVRRIYDMVVNRMAQLLPTWCPLLYQEILIMQRIE